MTQYQLDNAISAEQRAEFDQLLVQIIEEWAGELKNCPSYVSKVEKASPETRVNLLIFLIEQIRGWELFKEGGPAYKSMTAEMRYTNYGSKRYILAQAIARKTLPMSEDNIRRIFAALFDSNGLAEDQAYFYPIKYLLNQIKKQYPNPSEALIGSLKTAREQFQKFSSQGVYFIERTAASKIVSAFGETIGEAGQAAFPYDDDFAAYANPQLAVLSAPEQSAWAKIITLATTANAAQPSAKYLKDSKVLIDELGAEKFKKRLHGWIAFIRQAKDPEREPVLQGFTHGLTRAPIESVNQTAFKGLIWMCAHFHDTATISAIADLALHSYEKVPDVGARYQAIGNACFYALYRSKGLDGIAQLTRLRLRIKFS